MAKSTEVDVVRVQEIRLSGEDDPTILEWAAQEKRILLTHNVSTITDYAYDRVRKGQWMPGESKSAKMHQLGESL